MNEEIKKKIVEKYFDLVSENSLKYDGIGLQALRDSIYEIYILGAKDMAEAVKIEEEQPDLTGNLTISDIANITGYSRGFSGAVRATNIKAQQFIDSLEKE